MFTPSDLAQLEARGISVEKAEKQLQSFATGFPELDIVSAASVGNGVLNPSEEEIDAYVKAWQEYLDEGHTVLKFVPASGAASRMFKNLFEYLEDGKKTDFIDKFLSEKDRFAFGPQLAGQRRKKLRKSAIRRKGIQNSNRRIRRAPFVYEDYLGRITS